jgi:hypothetical protein
MCNGAQAHTGLCHAHSMQIGSYFKGRKMSSERCTKGACAKLSYTASTAARQCSRQDQLKACRVGTVITRTYDTQTGCPYDLEHTAGSKSQVGFHLGRTHRDCSGPQQEISAVQPLNCARPQRVAADAAAAAAAQPHNADTHELALQPAAVSFNACGMQQIARLAAS